MEDKRDRPRTRVRRGARIVVSDRASIMHCTVLDVTNVGARLSIASCSGLPSTFHLSFDSCRSLRQCRLVWTGQGEVGVEFVS
jgi:hypothetical protein